MREHVTKGSNDECWMRDGAQGEAVKVRAYQKVAMELGRHSSNRLLLVAQ